VAIGKKPVIEVEFSRPVVLNTVLVIVDGTDVTQILTVTGKGFTYTPIAILNSGPHTLSVTATDRKGKQSQESFTFTSRNTSAFEEAYSKNDLSVIYETPLKKPDSDTSTPGWKVEGNLTSETRLKEKDVDFGLRTTLRYLDQNRPLVQMTQPPPVQGQTPQTPPVQIQSTPAPAAPGLQKGISLMNYLFSMKMVNGDLRSLAELGDVQINETQNTVSGLARRGAKLSQEYNDYSLGAFVAKSADVFGFHGGLGIGDSRDDRLSGVSIGKKFFDKKLEFKTIYATGSDQGTSVGVSTTQGVKKGDTLGFLLTSDFFQNKIKTELETDFTKFDPDTSDEFSARRDKAYRLKAGGALDIYNYEAMYEYFGKDYGAIGNPMQQKDKEGVSLRGGSNFGVHGINVMFSRYNDNVKGDSLFPRIVSNQESLDYSFNGIPNLPVGINYQTSIQESTREPLGSNSTDMHTDTVSARINYSAGSLGLGLMTSYSVLDDRTPNNYDTTTITYTLSSSYTLPNISIVPALSLNQSNSSVTGVRTDNYVANLDIRTKFFSEMASFDTGGSYIITKANNGATDTRTLNANFRLAYDLKTLLKDYMSPIISLRGLYLKSTDRITHASDKDEVTLFLVLSTALPFIF
jgi:hypothetical protein